MITFLFHYYYLYIYMYVYINVIHYHYFFVLQSSLMIALCWNWSPVRWLPIKMISLISIVLSFILRLRFNPTYPISNTLAWCYFLPHSCLVLFSISCLVLFSTALLPGVISLGVFPCFSPANLNFPPLDLRVVNSLAATLRVRNRKAKGLRPR